ncbi:hypothetical protein Nmel_014946 [Mimus melanotis]
MHLIWTLAL